jgi:ubiquinone/menaquinone biosynthesis C-methylase UbiE
MSEQCVQNDSRESLKRYYETVDFSRILAAAPFQEFLEEERAFLASYLRADKHILEVGCGHGRLLELFSEGASRVVGIDFSKSLLDKVRTNLNAEVYLMHAEKMTLPSDSFDYVLCVAATFGNMPGIERDVLRQMFRVCRPGGEIILSVFSEHAASAQLEVYQNMGFSGIVDDGMAMRTNEGLYSRRFTSEQLSELLLSVDMAHTIRSLCPINYVAIGKKERL